MNAQPGTPGSEREAVEARFWALWRDRMAHYGYTPEQIDAVEQPVDHEAAGCYWENCNWVCTDEDEKPNHPDHDEAEVTAEWVCWMLDHPLLAAWSAQDRAEALLDAAEELLQGADRLEKRAKGADAEGLPSAAMVDRLSASRLEDTAAWLRDRAAALTPGADRG